MRNVNFLNYKKFILNFSGCALSLPLVFVANSSLSTIKADFLPADMIAAAGESKTNSYTTGHRATLNLSTTSSFGASASVSSTEAYSLKSKASFEPSAGGTWTSSFGGGYGRPTYETEIVNADTGETKLLTNPDGSYIKTYDNEGKIIAKVGNIKAENSSGRLFRNSSFDSSLDQDELANNSAADLSDSSTDGYDLNATQADSATGNAEIYGATSEVNMDMDDEKTWTTTDIEMKDRYEGVDDEGNEIVDSNGNYYSTGNAMDTANGSANLGFNNGLNVDLANTEFHNAFSQAFN